jgi:AraC-like DNA-binding protein
MKLLSSDRPVLALEDEYPAGFVDPMHQHDRVQILYASVGVMSVRTRTTSYVVPPQRAVWLPANFDHEVSCRGPISLRTLYLRPDIAGDAQVCRVFEVSRLLKALILETGTLGENYELEGRTGQIIDLLLTEIARMPDAQHQVPMPDDARLLRVCGAILDDPSNARDIDDWASVAGMARRTFTRAFKRETGMGFAMWRQQVRLMDALALLSSGSPITQVAFEVGYDSSSSFSAIFRRAFGVPPSRFLRPAGEAIASGPASNPVTASSAVVHRIS